MAEGVILQEPDALDQKGNRYYRRKLLHRVSLRSLGFDIGLGDFVRVRPYAEDHKKLVENPAGGRAYSPVFPPDADGKFGLIVKPYGPGDEIVGVSSLLKNAPLGSEFLVTNHVEHAFWEQRNKGYYCNDRNIDIGSEASYSVGLIAFGIGITEIAAVAVSELLDPRVKRVTILWAHRYWSDAAWAWSDGHDGERSDLVHQFFSNRNKYVARLYIKHILSKEEHPEALFQGRINSEILRKAFPADDSPKASTKFLVAGTTAMIDFAYELLAGLGLDIAKVDVARWVGSNLLYRKLDSSAVYADRHPSPLLESTKSISKQTPTPTVDYDDPPSKKQRSMM